MQFHDAAIASTLAIVLWAGALSLFVLAESPLPTALVPSQLRLTSVVEAMLAADGKKPEHSFSPGWLVAGIAGGGVTVALLASTRSCPGIDPTLKTRATILWSIVPLAVGTALGIVAAEGFSDGKTGVAVFDIVGPTIGGLVWLAPCGG